MNFSVLFTHAAVGSSILVYEYITLSVPIGALVDGHWVFPIFIDGEYS